MINKSLLRGVKAKMAGSATILLLAMGVMGSQVALAGIANTKHNLGSTGTGSNQFSGTGEICVFCHTPHGADILASVPLWNRSLAVAPTYTTYNSLGTSSLDGATVAVGSVSIACLSCHDGTQAMNTLINAPGSGLGGDAAWKAGAWTGPALAAGGKIGSGVTNLTADLRNDHPIGIQYGGGMPGLGGAYTAGNIADGGFKDADFKGVSWASLNGKSVWWVDTAVGGSTARQKTDMQLYTRDGATALVSGTVLAGDQAYVECASCHDPHTENQTFLRISNTSSNVCLACHIK